MTPVERVEAAGRWLAQAGGSALRRDVGAALGVNHARQAEVLAALVAAGMVTGTRLEVRLTDAGWARFGGVEQVSAGEVLDRVLDGWPYTHRAFLELLVCAVIARHHLGAQRREAHLGFIAIGETGTGKSAMGGLVCHLFGLPGPLHKMHVPAHTAGSMLGRRVQDADGWRFVPAPVTRLPFVMLDEFDKAEEPVQRRAWLFLDGSLDQQLEDQVHELLPTPLLTANPPRSGDRYAHLRQEYRRRSVVLDTGAMAGRSHELEDLLGRFYATAAATDRLHLDALVPPAALDASALEVLRTVRHALTPHGAEEFPGLRALELATLGRCALLGDGADQAAAAYATGVAYLQASESVPGQVAEGWIPDLAAVHDALGADAAGIAAALERGRAGRRQAQDQAAAGRARKARQDLDVLERGERLAERCRQAVAAIDGRKVDPARKAEAAGLRRVLRRHATTAAQVTTASGLAEVTRQAADPLERAGRLLAVVTTDRDAAKRAKQEDAEQDRNARQAAKAEHSRARSALAAGRRRDREELARAVAAARPLEALYARTTTRPGERPLDVLRDLRAPNGEPLLRYTAAPASDRARGWRGVLETTVLGSAPGTWRVAGSGAVFTGTLHTCSELMQWGAGTRAVLAPTLDAIHQAEDELRSYLGAEERRRPQVATRAGASGTHPVAMLPAAAARYGLGR